MCGMLCFEQLVCLFFIKRVTIWELRTYMVKCLLVMMVVVDVTAVQVAKSSVIIHLAVSLT